MPRPTRRVLLVFATFVALLAVLTVVLRRPRGPEPLVHREPARDGMPAFRIRWVPGSRAAYVQDASALKSVLSLTVTAENQAAGSGGTTSAHGQDWARFEVDEDTESVLVCCTFPDDRNPVTRRVPWPPK